MDIQEFCSWFEERYPDVQFHIFDVGYYDNETVGHDFDSVLCRSFGKGDFRTGAVIQIMNDRFVVEAQTFDASGNIVKIANHSFGTLDELSTYFGEL